jgi:hypothetical protein
MPAPDPVQAAAILRLWAALSLDSQLLAVVDVSGSMKEPVAEGVTRIELTRDAAKTALGLFPASSALGLSAFSVDLDPPNDHVELVPLGLLTDTVGSQTASRRCLPPQTACPTAPAVEPRSTTPCSPPTAPFAPPTIRRGSTRSSC